MDARTYRVTERESLNSLYRRIGQMQMVPGWNRRGPSEEHRRTFRPHHWSYASARAALDDAGHLIDTQTAERRNLILMNPIDANGTARTLMAAYQMILPGEGTRSHRHTPNALRLILDAGPGAYTIVDGKKLPMLPGDVLLTPSWSWHAHINEGDHPAYWLDFLDVPLIEGLGLRVFEQYPNACEGNAVLLENHPMRFRWSDIERMLDEDARDSCRASTTQVELGNPALPTIMLSMLELSPGSDTAAGASPVNIIFAAVCGTGTAEVEEEEFVWERGDVVVIPAHYAYALHAKDRAVLLSVSDAPVQRWLAGHCDRS